MRIIRIVALACCLLTGSLFLAGSLSVADADQVPAEGDARVDWNRGLVIATGAMAGDMRAPSPAVARVGAERGAREQAQARLLAAARKLETASGETVGAVAKKRSDVADRLSLAVRQSLDLDIDYSSDGSVVLKGGLAIEAVRAAVYGPDAPPEGAGDKPIAALVVDARKLKIRPVVGIAVTSGGETYRGPTVYSDDAKAVAVDARLAGVRMTVVATGFKDGSLVLSDKDSAVAGARRAGAVVVVLVAKLRK